MKFNKLLKGLLIIFFLSFSAIADNLQYSINFQGKAFILQETQYADEKDTYTFYKKSEKLDNWTEKITITQFPPSIARKNLFQNYCQTIAEQTPLTIMADNFISSSIEFREANQDYVYRLNKVHRDKGRLSLIVFEKKYQLFNNNAQHIKKIKKQIKELDLHYINLIQNIVISPFGRTKFRS